MAPPSHTPSAADGAVQPVDVPEPWGRHGPWLDRRKRDVLLASLPRERFTSGFQPECSLGLLTEDLAARCDELLATDASHQALARSAVRLGQADGVRFEQRSVPQEWPSGRVFDLVVLVDVGWRLTLRSLTALADRTAESLTPGGIVAACHWRHPPLSVEVSGEGIHRLLRHHAALVGIASHIEEGFVIDVLTTAPSGGPAGAARPPSSPPWVG